MFERSGFSERLMIRGASSGIDLIHRAERLSLRHSSVFLGVEAAIKSLRASLAAQALAPLVVEREPVELMTEGSALPVLGHQLMLRNDKGQEFRIRSVSDCSVEFGTDGEFGLATFGEHDVPSWQSDPTAQATSFGSHRVTDAIRRWLRVLS